MNRRIIRIINNSYKFINEAVTILEKKETNHFLHNNILINFNNIKNENTFIGKNYCGACCYVLDMYLKLHNIKSKLILTEINYGKYKEDHCYLLYKDKYIIDPTYKQFFDKYFYSNNYNGYKKVLYNYNNFIYIGTYNKLLKKYNKLNELHKDVYGYFLDDDILDFWIENYSNQINYKDISHKLDCDKLLNFEYANNKGSCFLDLHYYLKYYTRIL